MSTASMRSGDFSELDDDASPARKAVRWVLILLALALLAFLVAWLFGYVRLTTDPRIAEIQKMQADTQKQFMANGGPQTLDEAKAAVAAMGQIREKIDASSTPTSHCQPISGRQNSTARSSKRNCFDRRGSRRGRLVAGRADHLVVSRPTVVAVAGRAVQVADRAAAGQVGVVDRPAAALRKTATAGARTSSTARLPNSGHGMSNTVVPWRPAATNSGSHNGALAEVSSAGDCVPHGRHTVMDDTLAWTTP